MGNFTLYFYLAYLLAYYYPRYSRYCYGGATFLALCVGFSCLYVRVHWLSDIVAGYALGFIWLIVALTWLRTIEPKYLETKLLQ